MNNRDEILSSVFDLYPPRVQQKMTLQNKIKIRFDGNLYEVQEYLDLANKEELRVKDLVSKAQKNKKIKIQEKNKAMNYSTVVGNKHISQDKKYILYKPAGQEYGYGDKEIQTIVGDIFDYANDGYLVQTVSCDCAMYRGIAVRFNEEYGTKEGVLAMNQKFDIGDVVVNKVEDGKRQGAICLFSKLTKDSKPTLSTIELCLKNLVRAVKDQGIKKLYFPEIGCGLDLLPLDRVTALLGRFAGNVPKVEVILVNYTKEVSGGKDSVKIYFLNHFDSGYQASNVFKTYQSKILVDNKFCKECRNIRLELSATLKKTLNLREVMWQGTIGEIEEKECGFPSNMLVGVCKLCIEKFTQRVRSIYIISYNEKKCYNVETNFDFAQIGGARYVTKLSSGDLVINVDKVKTDQGLGVNTLRHVSNSMKGDVFNLATYKFIGITSDFMSEMRVNYSALLASLEVLTEVVIVHEPVIDHLTLDEPLSENEMDEVMNDLPGEVAKLNERISAGQKRLPGEFLLPKMISCDQELKRVHVSGERSACMYRCVSIYIGDLMTVDEIKTMLTSFVDMPADSNEILLKDVPGTSDLLPYIAYNFNISICLHIENKKEKYLYGFNKKRVMHISYSGDGTNGHYDLLVESERPVDWSEDDQIENIEQKLVINNKDKEKQDIQVKQESTTITEMTTGVDEVDRKIRTVQRNEEPTKCISPLNIKENEEPSLSIVGPINKLVHNTYKAINNMKINTAEDIFLDQTIQINVKFLKPKLHSGVILKLMFDETKNSDIQALAFQSTIKVLKDCERAKFIQKWAILYGIYIYDVYQNDYLVNVYSDRIEIECC